MTDTPDPATKTSGEVVDLLAALQQSVTAAKAARAGDEDKTTPEPSGTPEDAVSGVALAAELLNTALTGYAPDDWRDALRLLHKLRKATETLRTLDSTLATWVYLNGEHGLHQTLDGVGPFSVTRGRSKERWEVEAAVTDYVGAKIRDNGGELPDPETVIAWCLEVLPAGTSVSVKKTPLREAGLEVEDYYASEPGSIQVQLPR